MGQRRFGYCATTKRYYPEYAVNSHDSGYHAIINANLKWKPIVLTNNGGNFVSNIEHCKEIIDIVSESNLHDSDYYLEEIIDYNGKESKEK